MARSLRRMLAIGFWVGALAPAMADGHTRIPQPAGPPDVPAEYAELKEKLTVCFDCHAVNGYTPDPAYPMLSGQEFYYLYVQLRDFAAGRRASEVMGPIASDLTRDEMKRAAEFYAHQPWPDIGYRGAPDAVAAGERAAAAGQCVQCHLGGYEGNSRVPRLAGQYPGYLRKTLLDFKGKVRANSPAKSALMESFSDDDLSALAEFLANF